MISFICCDVTQSKTMYEDVILYFSVGLIGAFFVLSWVLLSKFKTLNSEISESADLGHDLWSALDSRMRKQDERILDLMTKFEVYRSKFVAVPSFPGGDKGSGVIHPSQTKAKSVEPSVVQPSLGVVLEPTERVVLQLLLERPRTSIEIKSLVNKSREHTARLMKDLFERRLVSRDDSKKPFVYQLTEEGRTYLSTS